MPMDMAGPNQCLVRYRTGPRPGTDLYICSHGGWDKKSLTQVPLNSMMVFWGPKDQVISAQRCYQIMKGLDTDVNSIAGGQATVWDYTITEFPGDWTGAIESVEEAKETKGVNWDCVMINDQLANGATLKLSDVFFAYPGYTKYHFMACRV